jgi:hypothetical protein
MAKRARKKIGMQDVWKQWGGPDAERYYGMEFTCDERQAIYAAIKQKTGLNYVYDLMSASMDAFGEAHNVPYCHTFGDDAIVYCCIGLGIDPREFPHNSPKRSIEEFEKVAHRLCHDFEKADTDMKRMVQRSKLVKIWFAWVEEEGLKEGKGRSRMDDLFESPDYDAIAIEIVKANEQRRRRQSKMGVRGLQLVHSSD